MTQATPRPHIIVIPGLPGHWQWMSPALRAFTPHVTVATFSLHTAPSVSCFDAWTKTLDNLIAREGDRPVILVGVSFGGIVASHYAAIRGDRLRGLALVSAPSPRWRIDDRSAAYLRHPTLYLPAFALRAIQRLVPEIRAAVPGARGRARFIRGHIWRAMRWPFRPRSVGHWIREWMSLDFADELRRIAVPTLVITGERTLDRVVAVESTLDYLTLIPHARHVTLAGTGHLGFLERPEAFAALVEDFAEEVAGVDNSSASVRQERLS